MRTLRQARLIRRRKPVVAGTKRRPAPEVSEEDPVGPVAGKTRKPRLAFVLLAVAVVFAGVGVWLRTLPANGDFAEVSAQVRDSLEKVFSYRYDDTATTERAARESLIDGAQGQYAKLFEQIRGNAPEQRITVTSKVVSAGVVSLDGDRARLLVFLDQAATRGDTHATSSGAAQVTVAARRVDGRWRISELIPH